MDLSSLASSVYNFIFDCNGGEIELVDLIKYQSPLKGFTEAKALEVLNSSEQEASDTKQKRPSFVIGINSNGRKTVRVSCKARLCLAYEKRGQCSRGTKCQTLHVCKGYLEGNCSDTKICSRSHNLLDEQNKKQLRRYGFGVVKRSNTNIRKLIEKNLPHVCEKYQTTECRNMLCQHLHICSRYVRDACCYCPSHLSHDLSSSHNIKILKQYELPENYLKCNILLPIGTKVGQVRAGERERNVKPVLNNLDTADEKLHAGSTKLIELPQNIFLPGTEGQCQCLSSTENREVKHGENSNNSRHTKVNWAFAGQANSIGRGSTTNPTLQKHNLQKWRSTDCIQIPQFPSTTSSGGQQKIFQASCSVPHGLDGREVVRGVGIARGLSTDGGCQGKPSNWVGRGRGKPLRTCDFGPIDENAGRVFQSTSFQELKDNESLKLEWFRPAMQKIQPKSVLDRVFNCIFTKFNGTAKFSDISSSKDIFHFCSDEEIEKWFGEHKSSFLITENSQGKIEEIKTISLRAKMCPNYLGKSSNCGSTGCRYFHICKDYIANGKCSQRAICIRNHGVSDKHNKELASELVPHVPAYTEEQFRQLIQSSNPQVCIDYNNKRCLRGFHCKRIHVCKSFISGKCDSGKCGLRHKIGLISPETKNILAWLNVKGPPTVNIQYLAKHLLICNDVVKHGHGGKESLECSSTESYHIQESSLGNHICMKFLLKRCEKGPKCGDHHCPMPYQWVYLTDKWHMLSEIENTNLERVFCQEDVAEAMMLLTLVDCSASSFLPEKLSVDFTQMEISTMDKEINFPIKRLSTESDVHILNCPLATEWHWFWKGRDGKFTEYQPSKIGSSSFMHLSQQLSKGPNSTVIEEYYLEGHSKYDYEMAKQRYRIYFRDVPMYQRAVDPLCDTKHDIHRRPKFVSREEFEQIRSKPCALPVTDARPLPPTWSRKMHAECKDHVLVQLYGDSKEYQEIESLFSSHMRDKCATICSIDRVQNPFLWEKYIRKKNHMQKMTGDANLQVVVDERLLFHGSSQRNVRRICKTNFDWRSYGDNACNVYGQGVYFAKDPSLSHWFCSSDEDGSRYMFVVNVVVGSYTEGMKTYRRPPSKDPLDPNSDVFDSCVDRVGDPQVFVVFDVDQYYPGYLVEYRTADSCAELETCSVQ